jgi:hypothetical protein
LNLRGAGYAFVKNCIFIETRQQKVACPSSSLPEKSKKIFDKAW